MKRRSDTVLIDQDTVYAPCQSNDRLLLGLKGSLNEYELDLLRQRSLSARYEKANRMHPPRQIGARNSLPRPARPFCAKMARQARQCEPCRFLITLPTPARWLHRCVLPPLRSRGR